MNGLDFVTAQQRVPAGWHVEGQVLPLPWVGWVASASRGRHEFRYAFGYTPTLALVNLGVRFEKLPTVDSWRSIGMFARAHSLAATDTMYAVPRIYDEWLRLPCRSDRRHTNAARGEVMGDAK